MTGSAKAATRQALPESMRRPITVAAALAAVVVALLAIRYAGDTAGGRLDGWATAAAMSRFPESPTLVLIDSIGEPLRATLLVGLLAGVCALLGRRRLAVVAILGALGTVALTTMLKPMVQRTIGDGNLSYPSGHTGVATALAMVGMLLVADLVDPPPWLRWPLVLTGTLAAGLGMALVQVALNNHYLTDTVGGLAAAVVVVSAVARMVDHFADRRVDA